MMMMMMIIIIIICHIVRKFVAELLIRNVWPVTRTL
jgi:hypothetical protein